MSTLVGQAAPSFRAKAVMPDNSIKEDLSLTDFRGRYVVLFFYPFDFSFVCPSELLALDHQLEQFAERECDVIGLSVDSHFTHLAWKKTSVEEGGIGAIKFPLVSDLTKEISIDYGVLSADGVALRATFLVDREGVVRHQVVNDPDIGRNTEDTLRTLDALKHIERTGEVCPANWEVGNGAIEATPAGVVRYLIDLEARS